MYLNVKFDEKGLFSAINEVHKSSVNLRNALSDLESALASLSAVEIQDPEGSQISTSSTNQV